MRQENKLNKMKAYINYSIGHICNLQERLTHVPLYNDDIHIMDYPATKFAKCLTDFTNVFNWGKIFDKARNDF